MPHERHRWVVILAGGEGRRMQNLIVNWVGYAIPKQFCVFVGTRSMLKHTLDRACCLVDHDRIVTVIGQGQRRFLVSACQGQLPGWLIEQPKALGTAPALFLAAHLIRTLDPEATLLILPSDHFAVPEDRFVAHLDTTLGFAQENPERLAVMGARPCSPETDYGWIQPVRSLSGDGRFRDVLTFREKPGPLETVEYFRRGFLWNTMVSAVGVKALWTLGEQLLPHITDGLRHLPSVTEASTSDLGCHEIGRSWLQAAYLGQASADFSNDLLQKSTQKVTAAPLEGVTWSDWGRPQRIIDSLSDLGKEPLFLVADNMFSQFA